MNDQRPLHVEVYGQTPYAYYLADFSRAERAKLWYYRNRELLGLAVITIAAGALGACLSVLAG